MGYTFLLLFLLIVFYLISTYPAVIASYLVSDLKVNLKDSKKLSSSVWFFLDKIKRQRILILFILFGLLFL